MEVVAVTYGLSTRQIPFNFQRSDLFQARDVTASLHRFSMTEQSIFVVTEASQVAEVRRYVAALAGRIGFSETDAGKAAIVATEAATTLPNTQLREKSLFGC